MLIPTILYKHLPIYWDCVQNNLLLILKIKTIIMQCKNLLQKIRPLLLLLFLFQLISLTCLSQEKRVELKEMKDTVNLLVTTIKELEKESNPDKKKIDAVRTRLTILIIYNGDKQCGTWPSPSTKIELIEQYWKCTFDNAPYGKKFVLNY